MDAQAVDHGPVVREPVELLLLALPVEILEPIFDQRAHLAQRDAAAVRHPLGPAGGAQTGRRSSIISGGMEIVNGSIVGPWGMAYATREAAAPSSAPRSRCAW